MTSSKWAPPKNVSEEHLLPWSKENNKELEIVVIRDMDPSTHISMIVSDLKSKGYKVHSVRPAVNNWTQKAVPLFFIKLEKDPKNKTIFNLKYIAHQVVKVEKYIPNPELPRCINCQALDHLREDCNKPPICAWCSGSHTTRSCVSSNKGLSPLCSRCGGLHPSSYKGCQVYRRMVFSVKQQAQETSQGSAQVKPKLNQAKQQVKPTIKSSEQTKTQTNQAKQQMQKTVNSSEQIKTPVNQAKQQIKQTSKSSELIKPKPGQAKQQIKQTPKSSEEIKPKMSQAKQQVKETFMKSEDQQEMSQAKQQVKETSMKSENRQEMSQAKQQMKKATMKLENIQPEMSPLKWEKTSKRLQNITNQRPEGPEMVQTKLQELIPELHEQVNKKISSTPENVIKGSFSNDASSIEISDRSFGTGDQDLIKARYLQHIYSMNKDLREKLFEKEKPPYCW